MIRDPYWMIAPIGSLAACAAAASPATPTYLAAHLVIERSAPAASSAAFASREADGTPLSAKSQATSLESGLGIEPARSSTGDSGNSAERVYSWAEDSVYSLATAPLQVSDIALQPGESLVSVAAGDTARWVVGETYSGSGAERRTHLLVKPTATGLKTNLLIATDRRVYHLELESLGGTPVTGLSWTYPADALLALNSEPLQKPVAEGIAIDKLNFNYRIDGDRPAWRPVRAFDDGRQVFLEFPPSISESDSPPLFVAGDGGRAELVNYRVRGRYYVVDQLFAAAELRLGERHQQVVRITRTGPLPGLRSGS